MCPGELLLDLDFFGSDNKPLCSSLIAYKTLIYKSLPAIMEITSLLNTVNRSSALQQDDG